MEDDDEFGDLYTDVLRPFTTTTPSDQDQKAPASSAAAAAVTTQTTSSRRPIDINSIDSDDEEILFGAPNSNSNANNNNNFNVKFSMQQKTLAQQPELEKKSDPKGSDSDRVSNHAVESKEGTAGGGGELDLGARVVEKSDDLKTKEKAFGGSNFIDEEGDIDVVVEERDDKDDDLVEKDENLVARNENIGNLVRADEDFVNIGGPMIPGVSSIPGISGGMGDHGDANFDEEYDSDSEDDLQIVLNNDNELGAMGMERTGGMGGEEDDEDDDDDPLVIVADNDNLGHQPMMEDQEWGEDAAQGAEGERKELGDAAKVNGSVPVPPKVQYGNHLYHHPFHSQFKYVRPGAAPVPGAAPAGSGGIPGQVRPPVNVGPVSGRGRGDWRPGGIKGGPPMQKGLHPGYGVPVWGSNASGRGLEFTLPSHKTIFEVDIDSFEEKPWRTPGIDISDFFNFGLSEESWKDYCKKLEQHRLETTMQGRIRVYESGRAEQEYDPDLPPELAAASGVQGIPSENVNLVKTDAGQDELSRGSARARPPLPTGRPIQVETNYTDRLPSIDTRQPRIRDSDAIIEIICQDSADGGSPENGMVEQQENEISREDLRGGDEAEDLSEENAEHIYNLSRAQDRRKKELAGRSGHFVNPIHDKMTDVNEALPFSAESSVRHHRGSRERKPQYSGRSSDVDHEERMIKGSTRDRSPHGRSPRDRSPRKVTNESRRDKQLVDDHKEESYESIDGKKLPLSQSPVSVSGAGEQDVEHKVSTQDEPVQEDRTSEMERESMDLDMTSHDDFLKDEVIMHSSKKQRLISRVDQLSQDIDDGEASKAARSSENSKARSGSSKDGRKSRDSAEDEVAQGRRSARMGYVKNSVDRGEDIIRRKGSDWKQETERPHISSKGREESYSRKGGDPNSNHLHLKSGGADRRRESDNTERALHQSDEDLHGKRTRVEDTRKKNHGDEIGSRHRTRVRESERSEKDEYYQLREHLDNGSRKGNYEKDMGLRHRNRDDSLKRRVENIDIPHNKRRKEEAYVRREQAEKEEILHAHKESSSRSKRERDNVSDERKRDDISRLRDDDTYNIRNKEEGLFHRDRGERQRDRDEWQRLKHSHEETLSKREREEARSGFRSARAAEEKVWLSHSRGKEEYRTPDMEYHLKESVIHAEQSKRKDRIENESLLQHKGREDIYVRSNQPSSDGRRARHERASTYGDRAANDSDNHRVHEKMHKEYQRKGKEFEESDQNSIPLSRRNQVEYSGQRSDMVSLKGRFEQRSGENEVQVNHQASTKRNEVVSSDDEQSRSRKGRSKLERWTSHKERDFSINSKSSSSLQIKEADGHNNRGPSPGSKLPDEPSKPVEDKQRLAAKDKDTVEVNNVDAKLLDNKHLDTVEKLKKRSERFKLPMPSGKEAMASKKVENEPPPAPQNETRPDTEIKPERPARKRRWTSN